MKEKTISHKKGHYNLALQESFLAAYASCAQILKACVHAKIAHDDHYRWLRDDPTYPARFENAKRKAVEYLETVAVERATTGVDEPVFYQGQECGSVKRYSDNLLMFTLKGAAPDKYRENINHSGGINLDLGAEIEEARRRLKNG